MSRFLMGFLACAGLVGLRAGMIAGDRKLAKLHGVKYSEAAAELFYGKKPDEKKEGAE